jgi:prepilin-type N-terminal cleavage/methylation domain-containing protein
VAYSLLDRRRGISSQSYGLVRARRTRANMKGCGRLAMMTGRRESRVEYRQRGVTAVELMVTLAIIGLVALSVLPFLNGVLEPARAKGAAEQVAAGIRLARGYAIGASCQYNVTLTSSTITIAADAACPSGTATEPQAIIVDDGTISCFLGDNSTACTAPWTIQFTRTGGGMADSLVCISAFGRVVLTAPGATCPA